MTSRSARPTGWRRLGYSLAGVAIRCWLTPVGLGWASVGAAQPALSSYRTNAALEVPLTLGMGVAAGAGYLLMLRKPRLRPVE